MRKLWVLFLLMGSPLAAQSQLPPAASIKVDYDGDIRPILSQNCYSCHGPEVQQSGLRLDLRQNALRGGDYGPVIVPGSSSDSKLIRRLVTGDGGLQMPPTGALSDEEIGFLRAWIDQGAEFRTEIVEAPPRPVDPKVAAVISAVRSRDRESLEKLIAADLEMVRAKDAGGSTLLHHAAGFGTPEIMQLLLDKGTDVNAKNRRSATPLHWAVHDEGKVQLLLSRGAAINAKQVEGRTPVYQAALLGGGYSVLRLLLEKGADPTIATLVGQTPLSVAAIRGDTEAMRLLVEKGANVNAKNGAGETPLMAAATSGNPRAVQLLLEKGADATVRSKRSETALGNASTAGDVESVRLLLDRGADVNGRNIRGYSPLMLAAGSDAMPADVVSLLLAKGADTSYSADYDETAHILAAKRGNTGVTRLLGGMGPQKESRVELAMSHHAATGASASQAIEKAMTLLEKQSHNFIRIGGCNSCHSQDLPSAAAGIARARGVPVPDRIPQLPASMLPSPERIMDLGAVSVTSIAWELFDLGMNQAPRNQFTDGVARYVKAMQTPEGYWSSNEGRRPPMSTGEFQAAALAIYSLRQYAPVPEKTSTDAVIAKAVSWLESAKPSTTQDRAFHLLGLAWGTGSPKVTKDAARALAQLQRADGGWNQLPEMGSDAYATGQALYALNVAGKMAVTNPVYRKGVNYLLRTQAPDGSWHVKTRAIWLQPYFESGFPYERDQFISTAGTAWATIALAPVAEPLKVSERSARR